MEKLPRAGESDIYVERGGVRHSKTCRACGGRGYTVAGGEWRERDVECDSCHGEGSYEDSACDCGQCCDLVERLEAADAAGARLRAVDAQRVCAFLGLCGACGDDLSPGLGHVCSEAA